MGTGGCFGIIGHICTILTQGCGPFCVRDLLCAMLSHDVLAYLGDALDQDADYGRCQEGD